MKVRTLTDYHRGLVRSVDFSLDGKRIVSGSHDADVKIWNVETGAEVSVHLVKQGVGSGLQGRESRGGRRWTRSESRVVTIR
jgi:WD40 repeat protein